MNILVTGHNGFIGRAVVHELMERGHWVRLFAGDVRDDAAITRQIHDSLDAVIHLAAKTPGAPPDAGANLEWYVDHNMSATIKLAAACEMRGVPMVYAATRVTEGLYGRSKAMAEKVAVEEYGAIPVRVSMAYGPCQEPPAPWGVGRTRLIPTWVCSGLAGLPIYMTGPLDCIPDLVYIEDVADAYADLVELGRTKLRPGMRGIEVAGPGAHTLGTIAHMVSEELYRQCDISPPMVVLGCPPHPGPPAGMAGLGTPLRAGLRHTIVYYRSRLGI